MNSEERLVLARKGVEPYASRYGYTATETQTKKRKQIKKTTTVLKVIGLLMLMVAGMAVILEQNHNPLLTRIPGAGFLLFVLLIALIPITFIKILHVTNLDKVQWSKEDLEKSVYNNDDNEWVDYQMGNDYTVYGIHSIDDD